MIHALKFSMTKRQKTIELMKFVLILSVICRLRRFLGRLLDGVMGE
jgi:hypothetical protein